MNLTECRNLIDDYIRWLKGGVRLEQLDDCVMITTPFLDRHNDAIQLFVEPVNGGFRLTDDGYTIRDLRSSGTELTTEKRRAHLQAILGGFGVHLEPDDEIAVSAVKENFPQKKHNLVQAILSISDMFVMGEEQVLSLFKEDVARFLDQNSIAYITDIKLSGKSGLDHKFDFGLPKTSKRPQRFVQAINRLNRDQASTFAFQINDVRAVRSERIDAYAFLNDESAPLNEEHIDALQAYEIVPLRWSQRAAQINSLNGS